MSTVQHRLQELGLSLPQQERLVLPSYEGFPSPRQINAHCEISPVTTGPHEPAFNHNTHREGSRWLLLHTDESTEEIVLATMNRWQDDPGTCQWKNGRWTEVSGAKIRTTLRAFPLKAK